MTVRILRGDVRDMLKTLPDKSVHTVVTSPPYWGLRDYGAKKQIGLERTPARYVARIRGVLREVRRVLRDDGTLWLNLGDSYAANRGDGSRISPTAKQATNPAANLGRLVVPPGLKAKDLCGIPWMVAFALRADGWYLRQDIIWAKPNPMPESVRDRCTKAHEYIFLLSKSDRYYYDSDAIAEPFADASIERLRQDVANQAGSDRVPGKTNGPMRAVGSLNANRSSYKPGSASSMNDGEHMTKSDEGLPLRDAGRNKRSVWTVTTQPFKEAHFATFPPALIEPCILAGCPAECCAACGSPFSRQPTGFLSDCGCDAGMTRGTVLDPFGGAGTTGLVADRLQRDAILIELNPAYADMAERRIRGDAPLFAQVGS